MEPVAHFGLGDFLLNVVDTEKTADTSQVNTRADCWPNSFFFVIVHLSCQTLELSMCAFVIGVFRRLS